MPLVADVVPLLNATVGSPAFASAWARIEDKVRSVRHSPSLLSYYVCDDCDNAASFPPSKMALLYEGLKALDPHHIITGAPWEYPWSLAQYGDDAGYLSLDVMQVFTPH